MGVLEPRELTLQILGIFYRLATDTRDRTPGAQVDVDPYFGMPAHATDLVARTRALCGPNLALETYVRPRGLAKALLHRTIGPSEHRALKFVEETEWTDVELDMVNQLEFEIKLLVHRLTEKQAWFQLTPKGGNPYEPDEPLQLGEDGLTMAFKITPKGLRYALGKIPGTRYEKGPRSLREAVGQELWDKAPEWAKAQERHGE